jgi:transaldolase
VCDSGDFATIDKYKPQDATTNPSLILAASKKPEYAKLIDDAVQYGKSHGKTIDEQVDATLDSLLTQFGKEILKIVPGKVSTEVDARFSFDTKASVEKALHIIDVSHCCTVLSRNHPHRSRLVVQRARNLQRPSAHQACLHMGRYPSCAHPTVEARH